MCYFQVYSKVIQCCTYINKIYILLQNLSPHMLLQSIEFLVPCGIQSVLVGYLFYIE